LWRLADVARATRFLSDLAGSHDRGLAMLGFLLDAFFALDFSATAPDLVEIISQVVSTQKCSECYNDGCALAGRLRCSALTMLTQFWELGQHAEYTTLYRQRSSEAPPST
jgi:hypothetical protein